MAPETDADPGTDSDTESGTDPALVVDAEVEHFKPTGTIFLLACFVVVLILLWASVYLILVERGVTV